MPEIMANTNNGIYPIHIRTGALHALGKVTRSSIKGKRAFVVTDENVAKLYLAQAVASLRSEDLEVHTCTVPAGEPSKSADMLSRLYEQFHNAQISRSDAIVALGGGVIGDLAGFAAASYLRGCPLIQVPTSLLAQVDSSVGGKTGIDLSFGKNLVGAFHQPKAVLIDPAVLSTLPRSRMSEGMAEVIKYGCIRDAVLFEELEKGFTDLEWILERCVRIKTTVVQNDEFDTGERMILNFGHTLGHAVEKVSGYNEITHGEAVAIGMVFAARVGQILGKTQAGTDERIIKILEKWNLPVSTSLPGDVLLDTMLADKKRLSGKQYFVLLKEIGYAMLVPLKKEELKQLMEQIL